MLGSLHAGKHPPKVVRSTNDVQRLGDPAMGSYLVNLWTDGTILAYFGLGRTFDTTLHRCPEQLPLELACVTDEQGCGQAFNE